ncbi:nitroreductase family protein [Caldisalinibacter kiritimatiensis]|uniref:Nitroreductase n=1 Tax=Caldisalinibacter kiritimatiensis TaxID=1304284 RepID=R1AUI8_9FIRM|nr:nitroreductase family protein [Caldisalinibacter kiritimatiensis]EOD00312.1 nitroreductase [Caldisalinibacter kiritimatiensis]
MGKLDFIYKRHSVRKFKDEEIPMEDIKEIIKAATYAPSGKNQQNWHFVIVKNKEKIEEMAKIVEKKNAELASSTDDEKKKKSMTKFLKYHTVFRNAPMVVLVFAGPYPSTGIDILEEKGATQEELNAVLLPNPGIQNVAAAMENLQLAAANLGYGTCWMTGPNYASKEITEYIGFNKEGYFLAAMTPLGVPEESKLTSPPRKPVEEVLTIIE